METKHILAAAYLFVAAFGGITIACLSKRARDVMFFLLVTMSAVTDRWDVNFVSREWYRGTTMGFEISLVDMIALSLLVSAILLPRAGEKRFYWPASLGFMLIFFGFSIVCWAAADPKLFGMFSLLKTFRGLIVFLAAALYVRSERELRIFLYALTAVVCYEGFQAIEQRYRYGIHRVFGDLAAPNSLSMYFCLTAPVFVAAINSDLPRRFKVLATTAIGLASIGVLLTISRTGIVTLGFILVAAAFATMSWNITARKILISLIVIVMSAGVLAKSWESISSRFGEATFEEEIKNKHVQGRGYYIRMAAALAEDHWLGVGPNNWSYWVSNKYGPRMGFRFAPYPGTDKEPKFHVEDGANVDDPQAAPAHNLAALTAGELGVGGLVLLLVLWMRWFQMGASFLWRRTPDPMRRMGVGILFGFVGIFLQSLTEWVFHQTAIFFTFNILLGTLASLYYLKRRTDRNEVADELIEEEDEEFLSEEDQTEAEYARRSPA